MFVHVEVPYKLGGECESAGDPQERRCLMLHGASLPEGGAGLWTRRAMKPCERETREPLPWGLAAQIPP